jgi:phosphoenolpyruvate carboxylase
MSSSLQTPVSSPVESESGIDQSHKISKWTERLIDYRDRIQIDPQFNPVKQIAFDISRSLEAEEITLADLGLVVKELCDRALIRRAGHIRDYFQSLDPLELGDQIRELVRSSSSRDGQIIPFEEFAEKWEKPRHGIVFTAHPTFLMSEKLRHVLVRLVKAEPTDSEEAIRDDLVTTAHKPDANISLELEHVQAQDAIAHAQEAVERINRIVLDEAREFYPEQWHRLIPKPVEINCWVGYDLDGRTDIRWFDSIKFRLEEKQIQLERHLDAVRATKVKADIGFHSSLRGVLEEIRLSFFPETPIHLKS